LATLYMSQTAPGATEADTYRLGSAARRDRVQLPGKGSLPPTRSPCPGELGHPALCTQRQRGTQRQVWLGNETPGWFLRAIYIHSFHLWLLSWPMLTSQVTQHVQTSSNGSESSWAKREPTLAGREEQAANVRTQG